MSKSEQNLRDAFAGESQANRKYLAFAKKADQEGHTQAAKLFRAAAEAETVHAHSHLRTLKGINSTAENLKEAIAGETHEFKSMYPEMIADAKAEDNKAALRSFNYANDVEKVHAATCTRRHWTVWTILQRWNAIMFVRYADTLSRTRPPMSVRFVRPRRRHSSASTNFFMKIGWRHDFHPAGGRICPYAALSGVRSK